MNPLFQIPENLSELGLAELQAFIDGAVERAREVAADPTSFATDGRSLEDVRTEMAAAVEAIQEAREIAGTLEVEQPAEEPAAEPTEEPAPADEPVEEPAAELSAEDAAAFEALAEAATTVPEPVEAPAPAATAPSRTASAAAAVRRAPARSAASRPVETEPERIALVAAAGVDSMREGAAFSDEIAVAQAMIDKRRRFGNIADGSEEDVAIARATWSDLYPTDRVLSMDEEQNMTLVAAAVNEREIRAAFETRRKQAGGSLTASGGLCAPVTPYYNLQMISGADRPVRAALPAFNADRGGIRAARPASLASITTGVGLMTAAQDAAGGTSGTKSCQVIDCPPFTETDVQVLYHCLKFGNLGARTFPERVAQWNSLVLAAHARLAERTLLTNIDAASTQVTAASLGLGASADLLSEIMVAAAGMRSRHRMATDAVLRVLLPQWVLNLVVSDVYRSQFGRWDMTPDKFVGLLRDANVEPSFYIDSASGKGQEFGIQTAGALLPFPSTVTWYLFPEGAFLFLDGGVLELGLVRDSVLNSTNDFEIFGESFENVAFIGVESLSVTSTVCDNGITAGTHNVLCPIDYTHTS